MLGILIAVLVIWLIVAVVGFSVQGLLWLAIAGIILFVITGAVGYSRRGRIRGPRL